MWYVYGLLLLKFNCKRVLIVLISFRLICTYSLFLCKCAYINIIYKKCYPALYREINDGVQTFSKDISIHIYFNWIKA